MTKKQANDENVRKLKDMTHRAWVTETDGKHIKIGDTTAKVMAGACETLEIREMLYGEPFNAWRILVTADGNVHLLKFSKELKWAG